MRFPIIPLLLGCLLSIGYGQTMGAEPADTLTVQGAGASTIRKEACFAPMVSHDDADVAAILLNKVQAIIGRVGCGAPDARYRILPVLDVEEARTSSGLVRNVTVAKGTLTLRAVSADDPDMVWHSAVIPLEATLTGDGQSPQEALARQIKVSDAVYVRFVRVARKKIADHGATLNTQEP